MIGWISIISLIPLLFEGVIGLKKSALGSVHIFITGLLIFLLTPIGGMPLFNITSFISRFGSLIYILLIIMIPTFILVAGASYSSKKGLEGVKEGFDKAYHRVPWSFAGFITSISVALGVFTQPSYGQAMGVEGSPMLLGISVFIIAFVTSLSYVTIVWGFWGD